MVLPGLRILVIDDDRNVLWVYVTLLRLEGAEVAGACSGREALRLSRAASFDVVISDLGLPDIPGDILIRTIRAAAPEGFPVLVVTGGGEQVQTRAYEAGADAVFTKPIDWNDLLARLGRLRTRLADAPDRAALAIMSQRKIWPALAG